MIDNAPSVRPLMPEDERDDEIGRPTRGVWMMLISMALAKLGTLAIVLSVDFSVTAGIFAAVTTWFWVIAGALLLSGPVGYAIRVRRVRARREQLEQSEWMTG